jgi:hypothetical protein
VERSGSVGLRRIHVNFPVQQRLDRLTVASLDSVGERRRFGRWGYYHIGGTQPDLQDKRSDHGNADCS